MKVLRADNSNIKNLNGFCQKSIFYMASKRLFDILGGGIGLILSIIPMSILAIKIKKDGPIFLLKNVLGKMVAPSQCTNFAVWYRMLTI